MKNFFKDGRGRIAVVQWPNVPLIGWFVCKLLSMVVQAGDVKTGSQSLSKAFLFLWAYLEITSGRSYFRRMLGAGVMLLLVVSYFKNS